MEGVSQVSGEMRNNLLQFVIKSILESHDTNVILLCCSSLADDSDTLGYHFLTSVIETLIGKQAQRILHVPGFCSPSQLSAEVEPETSCSHSDTC